MTLGLYVDIEHGSALPCEQFDFVEENVQTLLVPEQNEAAFQRRLAIAGALRKPALAANRLLPPDLKPVGPDVDEARLARWCETTMRRAEQAGVRVIVWGSGVARRVPEGWPVERAWEQFIGAVRHAAPMAERHGVLIVIEPVCRHDSNFIMSLADGARVVDAVGHPSVRLLADFWHMEVEGESPDELVRFAPILEHVHLSEYGMDRAEPGRRGDDFRPYLRALKSAGYDKGIVIESNWTDVASETRSGLAELRRQLAETGFISR